MSLLRPLMRTRILTTSTPLSKQARAVSTTSPIPNPATDPTANSPASLCANCARGTHNRGTYIDPHTGRTQLPDHLLISALHTHYLAHSGTNPHVSSPIDYSGSDSEEKYKVSTQSLRLRREKMDTVKSDIINMIAEQNTRKYVADDMAAAVQKRFRERKETDDKKDKESEERRDFTFEDLILAHMVGQTVGALLSCVVVWTIVT
jgi:hypothetical protein